MPTLNFLIAIIIGFVIGFLVELIMEVLYFRGWRRQVTDDRITQLEADLAAREEQLSQMQMDLETRDIKIIDLEGRLARGQERLNTLQRDAALQRQRAQAAADATGTTLAEARENDDASLLVDSHQVSEIADRASSPALTSDAANPDTGSLSAGEAAAAVDVWPASEAASKPESWLD